MKHGKPYEAFADGKCEARPVKREVMLRLLSFGNGRADGMELE